MRGRKNPPLDLTPVPGEPLAKEPLWNPRRTGDKSFTVCRMAMLNRPSATMPARYVDHRPATSRANTSSDPNRAATSRRLRAAPAS